MTITPIHSGLVSFSWPVSGCLFVCRYLSLSPSLSPPPPLSLSTVIPGSWDMDNPVIVDLMLPDTPPVLCAILVNGVIWVSAGSFITLLDSDTFTKNVSYYQH